MKIAIPYIESKTDELKYCLRGIEMYVDNPEVIIIGDKTEFKNVEHISYKSNSDYRWKELNIFEKLCLVKEDFLYFNDDFFLLKPFDPFTYFYYGGLERRLTELSKSNVLRQVIKNTVDIYGDIKSYHQHNPIFFNRILFDRLTNLDWGKEYGYCIKSIYCHIYNIEGKGYNDLKIRSPHHQKSIKQMIDGRSWFSTDNCAMGKSMISVMEELYPFKSKYE